jgi:hypothetical protein
MIIIINLRALIDAVTSPLILDGIWGF